MDIILWIVFGAVVGWLASLIMKTDQQQGVLFDIVVGIVGAVIGGLLAGMFGQRLVTGFNLYSFVVALFGAMIFIALIRMMRRV
jgi:uncharacterized membrane protein YeaQ/YmgE (transglycosylase-associated protein family)